MNRAEEIFEKVDELNDENKYMITAHVIKDGKVIHNFLLNDFPTADLMVCVDYLEKEFVKILKRGSTGNGKY